LQKRRSLKKPNYTNLLHLFAGYTDDDDIEEEEDGRRRKNK